jgi:hypothetical protein
MESKFTDAPEDENMIFRKVLNGLEIGVYPVMFGFRIRAGIVGEGWCHLDYCAGNDQKEVENIYSLCISIMNKRITEFPFDDQTSSHDLAYVVFKDFPVQNVKPMFNDHPCFMTLAEMCGPEIISIKLPNLHAKKIKHVLDFQPSMFQTMINMGGFDGLVED